MKTIFTLLLATLSASAFAYDGGKLTISVASSKNIQVYVDGRVYQDNDNTFVLNNIQPGNHTITIYKNTKNNGNGKNNRKDKNYQGDVLYNSKVYVRPSYHVDVMINRFGKAMVDERAINKKGYVDEEDNWYDHPNGSYDNDYHQAMSDNDFKQLVPKIRNQWFGKLNTAKEAVNANYFRTDQMKQILQIFSSETDRLELAKLSYRNIVDRQNFRQLYDGFSKKSQTELDRYVKDFSY